MIFAYTLNQVLCGEKSQTRRLIKPNEYLFSSENVLRVEIVGKRIVYAVGKSYAVQPGRGKKAVARITLTNIRREILHDISDYDVIAEGFLSRDAFIGTWRSIHGSRTTLFLEVWVLEFKLEKIIADQLKVPYEHREAANRCIDHGHDISTPISRLSRTHMHSRDHTSG